jgi:hypothetical protein
MKAKVTEFDHLQALPIAVVLRTGRGVVIERDESGWRQMGTENTFVFDKKKDFPSQILWTYADEIVPPDIDPDMAVELVRQLRQAQAAEQQRQAEQAQQAPGAPGVDSTGNNPGVDQAQQQPQPAPPVTPTEPYRGRATNGQVITEAGIQHDGR